MISKTELQRLWDAVIPQAGATVGRRADENHPLDFFITYDERNNMQLMLISDFLPSLPNSSQQISVRGNPRADGKYALCFSLEDIQLREQYISLCWDMLECSLNSVDKAAGVRKTVRRFAMWQKLFAELKETKISEQEAKGLIGELGVIRDILLSKFPAKTCISAWVGPIGADRDFQFEDVWYEAKAVSLSRDTVNISSIDQLDTDTAGTLAIVRLEKAADTASGTITLNSLVNDIRNLLAADGEALSIFENRLIISKYDESDERAETAYIIHRIEQYLVDSAFPRIRRSKIDSAISNGEYTLSIPGIQRWKLEA